MSDLGHTLAHAARRAQARARRRLLRTPLVGQREDAEAYAEILRHRRHLAQWFAEHTGWQLVVDESGGFARLHKTRAHADATRPARRATDKPPFDRRRYTLLCLALAALDDGHGQTTLRTLAEALTTLSLDLPGVRPYDAARRADRRALVDALRLLVGLGVLGERDGSADPYARGGQGDVLYDVDERRIAQLISAPSAPSLVDDPADLPVEVYPDTEEGARLRARHRVMRRLLEDPVVYYDDLGEEERAWLAHSLHFVHRVLEEDLDLVVERRAEGLLAVDPAGELADERFPDGGATVRHAALLLCEHLADHARAACASARPEASPIVPPVAEADVREHVASLRDEVGTRVGWARRYMDDSAGVDALADDALALLARFHLVSRTAGGVVPRAAIARFAAGAAPRSASAEPTLFGEETGPGAGAPR